MEHNPNIEKANWARARLKDPYIMKFSAKPRKA